MKAMLLLLASMATSTPQTDFIAAASRIDYDAVMQDIALSLTKSKSFWPADFGNYGPLLIRLAWHCSGSYRQVDGRGGCDGGRIRFDPERDWPDNTNLDKAILVLTPIKTKYGAGLSWGDLIVLGGTTAIKTMGGPYVGFCGGRFDDADGTASLPLGTPVAQDPNYPCLPQQGNCSSPTGTTTVGLIYVNPEGPMGVPNPVGSAPQIRDVFGRMGMSDRETVGLIGGGHEFGKTHGACLTGPGQPPDVNASFPWDGTCTGFTNEARGRGDNTFTSGFEGAWTSNPVRWSNEYFSNLINFHWTAATGPGGHYQWFDLEAKPLAPRAGNPTQKENRTMLTTDIALLHDPAYLALVDEFWRDKAALEAVFGPTWYKLTTHDMGARSRCLGGLAPPPQSWQQPDPKPSNVPLDLAMAKQVLSPLITTSVAPAIIELAWSCSSTFRQTDYKGGCSGVASQASALLPLIGTVMTSTYPRLSAADVVILGAQIAIERANGGATWPFCGGRVDSTSPPIIPPNPIIMTGDLESQFVDRATIMGLTATELALVLARPRDSGSLSNIYFTILDGHDWTCANETTCTAPGTSWVMSALDIGLKLNTTLTGQYSSNNAAFLTDFPVAWNNFVNRELLLDWNGKCSVVMAGAPPKTPFPHFLGVLGVLPP